MYILHSAIQDMDNSLRKSPLMNVQKTHKDFKWTIVTGKTAKYKIFSFNQEAVTNKIITVQTILNELTFKYCSLYAPECIEDTLIS